MASLCNNFLSFIKLSSQQQQPTKKSTLLSYSSTTQISLTLSSSNSVSSSSMNYYTPTRDEFLDGYSSNGVLSAIYPSLANANTLFFKSGYNVQVVVGDDENEEALLARFRRSVLRAGILQECKRRRFFENKREEKKRKKREAAKRNRRRRPPPKIHPSDTQEKPNIKDDKEEKDNWELPGGELPY
eukprot:TRINITY_DN27090_c0_g1_i1.p1 TRINITY_DN27090_c0_g1~~TRINITY_DN27090_c0_g1_i1.p1  ORF type:complete len:195 (-),score=47.62 TRINITY_DN27090_c0_g1_i1:175-732(-)